jgi:hypothetical protein
MIMSESVRKAERLRRWCAERVEIERAYRAADSRCCYLEEAKKDLNRAQQTLAQEMMKECVR